jgi:hypothetical protein
LANIIGSSQKDSGHHWEYREPLEIVSNTEIVLPPEVVTINGVLIAVDREHQREKCKSAARNRDLFAKLIGMLACL